MKEAHAVHHKTNAAPYGFFASPMLLPRGERPAARAELTHG
jgi:hypothetical protein